METTLNPPDMAETEQPQPTPHMAENLKQLLEEIKQRVQGMLTYTPKVGIFGATGAGKSSLCNALFGKQIAKISDVEACTRHPQEILIGSQNGEGGIVLVDVPGIGEDQLSHETYIELYKSLAPQLDLVLWAIRADDRAYLADLDAYARVFGEQDDAPPVLFVVTQVDDMKPTHEWNHELGAPGATQQDNIVRKEHDVSSRFNIPTGKIVSVSAEQNYNLSALVERMVAVLPNEKKLSITREAKEQNVSQSAREDAEKGMWTVIHEWAGDLWEHVREPLVEGILAIATPYGIAKVAKWVKGRL